MEKWPNNITGGNEAEMYDASILSRAAVMLLLCGFGLYGNFMSIIIFTKPIMRCSINILLAGLSFIDLFLLMMCIPVFILPTVMEQFGVTTPYYNPIIVLYFYPLTMTAQTCSIWALVVITLERFVAVCRPFHAHNFATVGRTKRALLIVIILAVLYNLVRFWEYRWKYVFTEDLLYEPLLRTNSKYLTYYYTICYLLTHFLIPFFIILILNIYIFRAIKTSQSERNKLVSNNVKQHQTSTMIIIVTVMFVILNAPAFILNIWEASNPDIFNPDSSWSYIAFLLLDISNSCIMINSSNNFIVYLIYCRRYRVYFLTINKCLLCCPNSTTWMRSDVLKNDTLDVEKKFSLQFIQGKQRTLSLRLSSSSVYV